MLRDTEKVERVLFQSGSFYLKNVILLGSKSNVTGNRLDPIFTRSYQSQKYTDRNQLKNISVRTSDYLTFSINKFDKVTKENKGIEIYSSYQNIENLVNFFNDVLCLVNTEGVFSKTGITPEYADQVVESELLCGGKKLFALPQLIEIDNGTNNPMTEKGVMLFLNDEEHYVTLEERSVYTIFSMLNNMNLMLLSNTTLMIGMLSEIPTTGSMNSGFSATPLEKTKFSGQTNTGRRSLLQNRKTFKSPSKQSHIVSNGNNNLPKVNQPTEEANIPQTDAQQEAPENKGKLNMKNILKESNEIDISDIKEINA